jgi:hypothetical protein
MAPGLGLLLGLALGLDATTLEAGVRAEARGQRFDQAGQPASAWVSLEATPWAALALTLPELRGRAAYEPRLTLPRLQDGLRPDVVHQLQLSARGRLAPTLQLDGSAAGASGTSRPADEARQARPEGEPSPGPIVATGVLRSVQAQAALRLAWRADPRTSAAGTVTWSRSGGADDASRAVMPQEQTLRLDATALWRATRVDELGLEAGLSDTRFDQGGEAAFGLVSASWRRRLQPDLAAWARGGAGGASARPAGGRAVRRAVFGGELGVAESALLPGLSGQLVLRASPVVDRLLGTVDARYEAELTSALALPPAWRLAARAAGALFRRDRGDARLLLADLRVDRSLGRHLTVGAGAYATRQVSSAPDLPSFTEGGLRVGLEWWATSRPERGDP